MGFDLGLDVFEEKSPKPSNIESIYFLFFEHGISLKEFNELPIPYIMSIIKTNNYIRDLEEKELKRTKNGTN